MPKKNDFKLDVVSVRLVKDAPIYSEHTFNNPADIAAVMGDCMCQFDREVVCVVNLRSDLKPINVHFASVGSLNVDCQHFFRQIFLGYFSDIVQAFDTLRKNVCGDDYTSLHNPIVLSSVLPAYGMFHSIQILFL